jgi:magnesium transporter
MQIVSYSTATGVQDLPDLSAVAALAPEAIVWVDIESNEPSELEQVARAFALHELAVEDCLTPGHFPKLEEYGAYVFMVLRSLKSPLEVEQIWASLKADLEQVGASLAPVLEDEDQEDKFTRKVAIFHSKNVLITFRRFEVPWLDALVRQIKQSPERSLALGTDAVAHRVLDVLIDRFARGQAFFERSIDKLERLSLQDPDQFQIVEALAIKKELLSLRQVMRDQRVVISKLASDPTLQIGSLQRRYFKDIDDHSQEIVATIDRQLDELSSLRDTFYAITNTRLSDTMRILAVITTIAAPLNILVGIYGMNFDAMPLIHSAYGFWVLVGALFLVTLVMLAYFRSRRWL